MINKFSLKAIIILTILLSMSCSVIEYDGYKVLRKWTEEELVLETDLVDVITVDGILYEITYDLIDDYDYCIEVEYSNYKSNHNVRTLYLNEHDYNEIEVGEYFNHYLSIVDRFFMDNDVRRLK